MTSIVATPVWRRRWVSPCTCRGPTTGAPIPIFGAGGAKAEAAKMGVPLLAEIPLEVPLREACDAGRPLVATAPDGAAARGFIAAAKALA